ncbi:MAG: exodeoxyribonuclease V subunit alpha [Nocardioidaceae bacterium]|nr:MAG: exodeoxyribonuclease V subunit alpha [Nocardioidaceae bacterium]
MPELTTASTGVESLTPYAEAGVLEAADVQVAAALTRLIAEPQHPDVVLAVAMAVRAVRHGSVCLELDRVAESVGVEDADEETLARLEALAWPEVGAWCQRLTDSSLVATANATGIAGGTGGVYPLRLEQGLLYLDRYWRQERLIAEFVDRRASAVENVDEHALSVALQRLFPDERDERQRAAASTATRSWNSVVAGGPGTGKTTTVAKLLAVLCAQPGPAPRIALAAPTGKAAARLSEAVLATIATLDEVDRAVVTAPQATTIHRLLGWVPSRNRFRHNQSHRLPYDVVVIDEASMVSMTLMARLVEALRPDTRLVLVGDPDQLASVDAGAVLRDLTERSTMVDHVVTLSRVHRFAGEIHELASGIRQGNADRVMDVLRNGNEVVLTAPEEAAAVREELVMTGRAAAAAATTGDAMGALEALERHRVLCAHREGPYGVTRWSMLADDWLREDDPEHPRFGLWYPGRPLMVTSNDRELGLFNGDTGVVVASGGRLVAAFRFGDEAREIAINRLSDVVTVNAMSIHKSQGSQFDAVTVVLPDPTSPLLTRELLYTAVTRAKERVRIVGTEAAVRAAVDRRIQRASGLQRA